MLDTVQLDVNASNVDFDIIINSVYRQILGNAHVMDSERLWAAESQLRDGRLTVRGFVRAVAKSPLYRARYVENCPRYRTTELNFKHLLGRAPRNYAETVVHSDILDQDGFEADIDAYLNSIEYDQAFGEWVVPYDRGDMSFNAQTTMNFVNTTKLQGAMSSSDVVPQWVNISYALMKRERDARPISPLTVFAPVAGRLSSPFAKPSFTLLPKQMFTPVECHPGASESDLEGAIRAAYRSILGNAHVMESERLTVPESQFRRGQLSVREFVRAIAQSELYRSRFFDNCPRYRATELNFKHLLGRAPHDYGETFYHSQILDTEGFAADIDTYIDSDEYMESFGENTVPFWRGDQSQVGQNLLGFINSNQIQGSYSTSDKAIGSDAKVATALMRKAPLGRLKTVDEILKSVLMPRTFVSTATSAQAQAKTAEFETLKQECQAQNAVIAKLQAQLADLRPAAALGIAVFGSWQSDTPSLTTTAEPIELEDIESYPELQSCRDQQQNLIETLQSQIADARRYEAVAGGRLNRWRNRSF
ncbi:MAG: phycobilisome rod-core linker polypeptide [Cyanobacteria bacterium P01_G01_bin.54]